MPPPVSSPRGRRSALRGRADGNIAAVSHGQHVPTPTAAWRANKAVSRGLVTLTFDLESGVRITCDVGYLCANFGLPIGLSILELGPYVCDRQTDASDKSLLWAGA